jgi:hypothetical protein
MGDRPISFLACAWVRTKCAQKTHVGLWERYMILESCQKYIPLVQGLDGVLQVVWEPTLAVSQACVVRGSGIWCIAYVGPVWSHGMAYDNTRHTDVAKGGRFLDWGWPTRTSSSKEGGLWYPGPWDGDILAQALIELIEYSYQQGASSFSEVYLKKNL